MSTVRAVGFPDVVQPAALGSSVCLHPSVGGECLFVPSRVSYAVPLFYPFDFADSLADIYVTPHP